VSELRSVRGVASSYAQTAEFYLGLWSPVIRPVGRRLLEALPLDRAGRVLDAGTGVGALVGDIRELAPGATVVAVDLSEAMLAVARRSHAIPFAAMDARRLALASATFDVAALPFMLFHIPEPVEALREVRRVVRPGGTVGVVTWGEDPPWGGGRVFQEEIEAAGAGPDPLDVPETHEMMNTPDKVESLLSDAGLEAGRVWVEPHEHRWDPEQFKTYLGYGARRRRLETLPEPQRAAVMRRVRERLDALEPDGWIYRFTCVLSVARRP
jgi:SAM-dependent methyltransferase